MTMKKCLTAFGSILLASCVYQTNIADHTYTMVKKPDPNYLAAVRSKMGTPFWIGQDIYVGVDPEFDTADISVIQTVISEYNYVLNGNFRLHLDKHQDSDHNGELVKDTPILTSTNWHIFKLNSGNSLIMLSVVETTTTKILAFAEVGGSKLYIVRDRISSGPVLQALVRHEIGHLLGAHHTNKPSSGLMGNTEFDLINYQCVDQETTDQIAFYNYLDKETMNYCKRN